MNVLLIRHAWSEGKNFKISRPNGAPEYIFLHFWNPMNIMYEGEMITTSPNACIIFSPSTPQYFGCSDTSVHDWMHLTNDVSELLEEYQIETEKIYYPKNHEFITDIIRRLEVEHKAGNAYGDELCDCYIRELFARMAREIHSGSENDVMCNQIKTQMSSLRQLICSDYTRKWKISDMTKYANISPSYLYSAYQKLYGVSPIQDLINVRMQKAKSMLSETQRSVNYIATFLGYSNTSHFIRQFTKSVGMSPLKYRQTNKIVKRWEWK